MSAQGQHWDLKRLIYSTLVMHTPWHVKLVSMANNWALIALSLMRTHLLGPHLFGFVQICTWSPKNVFFNFLLWQLCLAFTLWLAQWTAESWGFADHGGLNSHLPALPSLIKRRARRVSLTDEMRPVKKIALELPRSWSFSHCVFAQMWLLTLGLVSGAAASVLQRRETSYTDTVNNVLCEMQSNGKLFPGNTVSQLNKREERGTEGRGIETMSSQYWSCQMSLEIK